MTAADIARAECYERALMAAPVPLLGCTAKPYTLGRHILFQRLCAAYAEPVIPNLLSLDPSPELAPAENELLIFGAVIIEDAGYLELHRHGGTLALAIGGLFANLDERDEAAILRLWRQAREDIASCGVDVMPRPGGRHDDCPLPPDVVAWPPGHAGLIHAIAKGTGWTLPQILWDVPLAAALSHAHCEWVINSSHCAPRGYLIRRRAEIAQALAAENPLPENPTDFLDDDPGADAFFAD